MTTRKDIIVQKYCILERELLKFLDCDILPDINDVEVCDLVFMITYQFMGIENDEEYEKKIVEMIKSNDLKVNKEDLKHIVPLISSFVQWLKQI